MEESKNKFHALQLFTDTFAAETVHLTNEAIGIYIRLLCFCWTKNAKPFSSKSAYIICQCRSDECEKIVNLILDEFFIFNKENFTWTHKRLTAEHEYLTAKYKKRSESGRKGGLARSKNQAPIPIPNPIPNINKYDPVFENLWDSLSKKRGSKFKAHETWLKLWSKNILKESDNPLLIKAYHNQIEDIEDVKFVPHFSTWLSQRRWENDEKREESITIVQKMEKLGYVFRHTEANFDYFKKDGIEYKIDKYDKDHIIHRVE